MISDTEIENFFRSMRDIDRDLIVIEEFKNEMKKVQGTFSETE
jgi:hypothetical protein